MLRILLLFVLSFAACRAAAQLSLGQEQLVRPLHDMKIQSMPKVDNEQLLKIELNRHRQDRPTHFAHPFAVDINPSQTGHWDFVGETAIWRTVVESRSAYSINLGFSEYYLPQEAALYIYDYHQIEKSNPFTAADNEDHEQLWTPIISSDKIVIEVNIPIAMMEDLRLQLSYVNHDFIDIRKSTSKSCHIDVNCSAENGHPEVEEFRNQIRAVGLFTLSGSSVCSGFLINNTRQDCTPYFMTAFHCNLNQENAPSMVTYWNYENSSCREPGSPTSAAQGDGSFDTFNTGATWRAGWQESDFTLVELDDEVPESANAYFAGWDINNNPPDRAVLIHHPNLEEKRISFADANLFTGIWGAETKPIPNGNHLVLNHWDKGSTEDGSSGGPLFNRQGLVVGQLHGGLASCDNQAYDAFGRLFSSWTGGNTATTRLKDYLDPDGTGRVQQPGKNCIFEITFSDNHIQRCATDGFFTVDVQVDDSFLGFVNMTFEGLPTGVGAFFSNDMILAGQVSTLTLTNINNLTNGLYTLDIVADNGQHIRKEKLFFEVSDQSPSQAVLTSPMMEETVGIQDLMFAWVSQEEVTSYEFQLSENENLLPPLVDTIIVNSGLSLDLPLTTNQDYFWRVRGVNACGVASWPATFRFNTADITCSEKSNTFPYEIANDATSIISSVIRNDSHGVVQNIRVTNVNGQHSFLSDLKFTLTSPTGTEVILMSRKCTFNEDFNLGFSDTGIPVLNCPPTNGFLFQPEMPLATFIGQPAHGDWTLKVEDLNKFDGGVLNGWSLEICANPSNDFSISTNADSLVVCISESLTLPLHLGAGYETSENIVFECSDEAICEVQFVDGQGSLVINPTAQATAGIHSLEIKVNDESGNESLLELLVDFIDLPSNVSLLMPEENATQVEIAPSFSWSPADFTNNYRFELAREASFGDLILNSSTVENEFTVREALEPGEGYFWRVAANNICGEVLSQTNTFTTENTNSTNDPLSTPIEVYPNPTQKQLHVLISSPNVESEVLLSLFTLSGKKVVQNDTFSSTDPISLDIRKVPGGIYILSVQIGIETHFSRIVVQ